MSYHLSGMGTLIAPALKQFADTTPKTTSDGQTAAKTSTQATAVATTLAQGGVVPPFADALAPLSVALSQLMVVAAIYPHEITTQAINQTQQFLAGDLTYGPLAQGSLQTVAGQVNKTTPNPNMLKCAAAAAKVRDLVAGLIGAIVAGTVQPPSAALTSDAPMWTPPNGAVYDPGADATWATTMPVVASSGGLPSWALPAAAAAVVGFLLLRRR